VAYLMRGRPAGVSLHRAAVSGACRGVRLDSRQPSSTEVSHGADRARGRCQSQLLTCAARRRGPAGGEVHRIGYLGNASALAEAQRVESLREGLRDFGYVEGKNIVIEFRGPRDSRLEANGTPSALTAGAEL
jgi:hypothetical protein